MSSTAELLLEVVRLKERIKDLKAIVKDIKKQIKEKKHKNEFGNTH